MSPKRKMFDTLGGDVQAIAAGELHDALWEITSGMSCFGPRPEWTDWFHHLLGQLVPRSHENWFHYLLEDLISAFISVYPNGIESEPYPGFRWDALNTLGRCIMDRTCWSDGRIIVGEILHGGEDCWGFWHWFEASGDFSASMFFYLKYLSPEQIDTWMKSALRIDCPHWRAQVMVWFVGAYGVLVGDIRQPSKFKSHGTPSIDWEGSYLLDGNYTGDFSKNPEIEHFLPERNRLQALVTVDSFVTEDVFLEWSLSVAEYDYLERELGNLPDQFRDLYMSSGPH